MSTSRAISPSRSRWSDEPRFGAPRVALALLLTLCAALAACRGDAESPAPTETNDTATVEVAPETVAARPAPEPPAFPEATIFEEPEPDPGDESATAHLIADESALTPTTPPTTLIGLDHPLLERVVLIGASLTQGFGATMPIENASTPDAPPTFVPIALGDALVASLRGDFTPAVAQGDMFFFLRPDRAGQQLARMALSREPTLLVALDFLFWFGYGALEADETRAARLERGFALLAPFECPIVVSDFPDLNEAVGRMISRAQMPTDDELDTLNRMLREWADARGDVAILPLADLLATLRSGAPILIADATWEGDAVTGLLQEDRMHATPAGMLVVIRQLLAEIVGLAPTIGSVTDLAFDPAQALERLHAVATARVSPAPVAEPQK